MSNLNTHGVNDYATAKAFLAGRYQRTLCYATTITDEKAFIVIRHHGTAIVRYWGDASPGQIDIRNGGWLSSTTTTRLHALTPREVFVSRAKGGSVVSPVYNGWQPSDWQTVVAGASTSTEKTGV